MRTGVRAQRSKPAESQQPRVERSRGCYLFSANDIGVYARARARSAGGSSDARSPDGDTDDC